MAIPGIQNPAIPYGSLVVVSGVSGFIGSHVADQVLAAGYNVLGTSRDSERNAWMLDYFRAKYGEGRFELAEVKDMAASGAFDDVVKGASGFIHVAHDMTGSRDPKIAIPIAINGALNALNAAANAGLTRFVYTSSSYAVTQPKPGVKFTVSKETFNEEAVAKVNQLGADAGGATVYAASKVHVERALEKWQDEIKSNIIINTIQPNANIGPVLNPPKQGYPTSASWTHALFTHNYSLLAGNPGAEHYINVQDDAKLHVIALAHRDVTNRRILAMAAPVHFNDIIAILRTLRPGERWEDWEADERDLCVNADKGEVEGLLKGAYGHGYTGLEESVKGNVGDLLEGN